jgi:hypothetical protein
MKTKKDYERKRLNQFKAGFAAFPDGEVIDSESPDFIIDGGNRRVGFEVTRIYKTNCSNDPPMQAIESACRRIAETASVKCDSRQIPPLTVSLHFIRRPQVLRVQRDALAKKIADFVCNHIPKSNSYHSFEHIYDDPTFPEHIRAITIGSFNVLTKHHFNVPTAGWVQKNFIMELQRAIDSKNQRLCLYKNNCTENWLLIISAGNSPSTFFEPSGDTLEHVFKSDFNRTFYMEAFSQISCELKTE